MGVALRQEPPGVKGEPRFVDGGIAIRHIGWLNGCNQLSAFAIEELSPLPESLVCPACGEDAPLVGPFREKLSEVLAAVLQSSSGDIES